MVAVPTDTEPSHVAPLSVRSSGAQSASGVRNRTKTRCTPALSAAFTANAAVPASTVESVDEIVGRCQSVDDEYVMRVSTLP